MRFRTLKALSAFALACTAMPAASNAAEYLTEVVSRVHQSAGTPSQIARKAARCANEQLTSGYVDADTITLRDYEAGIVMATSEIRYRDWGTWVVRSTLTFEARQDRFRIKQNNFQRRMDDGTAEWLPIGKWTGSGWKKAEKAIAKTADKLATCVNTEENDSDW